MAGGGKKPGAGWPTGSSWQVPPPHLLSASVGWLAPQESFDRERDGTPAHEGRDPLHLPAALGPLVLLTLPVPASHQLVASSPPGWTAPSSVDSQPTPRGFQNVLPVVSRLYGSCCHSRDKKEEGLPGKDKALSQDHAAGGDLISPGHGTKQAAL